MGTGWNRRKEENVLFNDALNIFYLRLYGVGHKVLDHSDSERGNPMPSLHGLFFQNSSEGSFICSDVAYWLKRDVDQRVLHEGLISRLIAQGDQTLWNFPDKMPNFHTTSGISEFMSIFFFSPIKCF